MGMQIVSSGMAVPDHIQTAEELAPLIGKTAEWIVEHAGVSNRRVCDDQLHSTVLAARAARQAIQNQPQKNQPAPDLLIYAGGVQHQALLDTSVFVAGQIGFEGVPAFSIASSCLSFLVALHTADALLNCDRYSKILIVSSDLGSRARNMAEAESAAILGDGAAAVIVEKADSPAGILHYAMQTWPDGAELAEIRGGGTRVVLDGMLDAPNVNLFRMDGRRLIRLLKPHLLAMLENCCRECGIELGDIDCVIPHQTSKAGFDLLARVGLPPEKTVNILGQYGNCVAAAMPMALTTALANDQIQSGDTVLFIGTGAGVSAATMLVQW